MPKGGFATTRWTIVMKASRESTPGSREALARLCETYWPPLYGFARRQGCSVEQAQDLTQAFFARFLEKHDVRDADPARGKFRSFLLSSFKHFVANEYDRERAKKRGGGQVLIPFEVDAAEERYSAEPADKMTPEMLFERQWAFGLVERVMAALRADLTKAGKADLFDQLKDLLTGEKQPGGYAGIARALGISESAVKVTVHRLRRKFRDLLRAEIAATVSDDAEIEDEIRYLMAILAQ